MLMQQNDLYSKNPARFNVRGFLFLFEISDIPCARAHKENTATAVFSHTFRYD
jgi:hypothetical protein